MATRPKAHCSVPLCNGSATHRGRCEKHARKADRQRGTSTERGYTGNRWESARRTTLQRDPFCMCGPECCAPLTPERPGCGRVSEVADHYPKSRKQLLTEGVRDPDDPKFLRGLTKSCHARETARLQPGGWAER